MKKKYLVIAALGGLICTTGCNRKATTSPDPTPIYEEVLDSTFEDQAEPLVEKEVDTLEVVTIIVEHNGVNGINASFKFTVDFPFKGPEKLVTNLRKSIFRALGDTTIYTDYSITDMENIGKNYVARATKEIQELQQENNERTDVGYANMGKIEMKENKAHYMTYYVDSYVYEGGAHGMPQCYYQTFDKKEGRALKWQDFFDENQRDALAALVKQAIVDQYYEGQHEWDEFFKFALPQQAPALTAEGVVFYYEPYEIDAYAAGMPHCVLTYQQVKGLMTKKAQGLIEE